MTRSKPISPALERLVHIEAWAVVRRFPQHAVEAEDLISFGMIGLLEAEARFDPRRGVNFEIFARYRIRGAIYDGVREMGLLGRQVYRELRTQVIAWETVGEPTGDARGPRPERDSAVLYDAIVDLATAFLVDAALESTPPDPETTTIASTDQGKLREHLDALTEGEQEVIRAVYDFDLVDDSGAALARRQGRARSSISRAHRAILTKLRLAMGVDP